MRDWPTYLPNQIVKGNPDADTVVVCCWEPREGFVKRLMTLEPRIMERIAGVGNLYTQERGIDFLLRNILANPNITRVLVAGRDRTGAGEALLAFFNGTEISRKGDYWFLPQYQKVKIRCDIPVLTLVSLRSVIKAHWIKDLNAAALYDGEKGTARPAPTYHDPPRLSADRYPTYEHGHVIRGPDIPTVYLDMLYEIMTFGRVDTTHYDQRQRELLDLMCVITAQDPDPQALPLFIPFDIDHLREYDTKLNSPERDPQVTYEYGHRIRAYFKVDQFKAVCAKLVKERDCRSALISTWDPAWEGAGKVKGSPCLNTLWFRIREDASGEMALHVTAIIRSNDMFTGWPENAFGLRMLQERMRIYYLKMRGDFQDDKGLRLGELAILSESAHLYEDCWEPAREIIEQNRKFKIEGDPKGNWIVRKTEEGEIEAALMEPGGFDIVNLKARTANGMRMKIAKRNLVADISHAMYLGELFAKAENAKPGIVD